MKKVFYLLFLIWPATIQVYAQYNSSDPKQRQYTLTQKKQTFAVQPFQLFNNSLRFDYERRISDGPGWIQFGPAIYVASYENRDKYRYSYDGTIAKHKGFISLREPYSEMLGGGLDINYKRFYDPKNSLYVACGLSCTYFDFKYLGWEWDDFIQDGLEYREYTKKYHNQHILRPGINCFMGYQVPSRHAFLFDMFWGFACRYSIADENKPAFNNYMFSYGYTGFVFITGVRFGIAK